MQLRLAAIVAGVATFWAIGGFDADDSRAPERARTKASLCSLAQTSHAHYIEGAREMGLVRKANIDPSGAFVLVVDEAMWDDWLAEQKELLAVAGWCTVAGDDGRGVAIVVSARDNREIASVIDGEFALTEAAGKP